MQIGPPLSAPHFRRYHIKNLLSPYGLHNLVTIVPVIVQSSGIFEIYSLNPRMIVPDRILFVVARKLTSFPLLGSFREENTPPSFQN